MLLEETEGDDAHRFRDGPGAEQEGHELVVAQGLDAHVDEAFARTRAIVRAHGWP